MASYINYCIKYILPHCSTMLSYSWVSEFNVHPVEIIPAVKASNAELHEVKHYTSPLKGIPPDRKTLPISSAEWNKLNLQVWQDQGKEMQHTTHNCLTMMPWNSQVTMLRRTKMKVTSNSLVLYSIQHLLILTLYEQLCSIFFSHCNHLVWGMAIWAWICNFTLLDAE